MIDKTTGEIYDIITTDENGNAVLAKQAHDTIIFYENEKKMMILLLHTLHQQKESALIQRW